MSKHTPGPWTAYKAPNGDVQVDSPRGTIVTSGAITWVPNADLIAAAPELLEACKAILAALLANKRFETMQATLDATIDAIAKAEGRS